LEFFAGFIIVNAIKNRSLYASAQIIYVFARFKGSAKCYEFRLSGYYQFKRYKDCAIYDIHGFCYTHYVSISFYAKIFYQGNDVRSCKRLIS
jgi:hypothetical protein